jgi:hypothetical protein
MDKIVITNNKKEMEKWIKEDKNNIILLGIIPKRAILYSKEWLNNCNILGCIYTSIQHHLSFKRTAKNAKYHLLDNLLDKDVGLICEDDIIKIIIDNNGQIFNFTKDGKVNGVLKTYVENSIGQTTDKYLDEKYKDAFYFKKDVVSSKYTFLSNILHNTYDNVISDEKIFKFSQDLYKKINDYLNGDLNKEDEVIEKTINAMDEMFMIAPLSEDDMILYRGYDMEQHKKYSTDVKEQLKFGIQNGYLSTTSNEYLGFYYTMINYPEYIDFIMKMKTIIAPIRVGYTFGVAKFSGALKAGLAVNAAVGVGLASGVAIGVLVITINAIMHKIMKIPNRDISNICCFTILHLDDGIPYIKLNNLSCYDDEVLLPRGLEMEHMYSDDKHPLLLKNAKGKLGYKTFVTAHHIRVSMPEELKKKYKKSEKCVGYDVWRLSEKLK